MATPLTASQMYAALIGEGLDVVEHPGWKTHDRGLRGDGWGPVHGLVIHHTGGTAPSDGEIVWSGRPDLPGPCAHGYLAKSGTLTLTSAGRANHAGGGDPAVLAAVTAESYDTAPPAPHEHEGSAGAVDGNARFYGLECSNKGDGKDPWPAAQYDAAVRWAAAICRAHGWSAKSVIGHKEWSDWKSDPTFDMVRFRADVQARLDADKPKPPKPPVPPKPATKTTVSLAHVVAAARRDPGLKQGGTTYKDEVLTVERALVAEQLLDAKWADGSFGSLTVTAYAKWQRRCGYTSPAAADGIPGKTTLEKLGARHGFNVKA